MVVKNIDVVDIDAGNEFTPVVVAQAKVPLSTAAAVVTAFTKTKLPSSTNSINSRLEIATMMVAVVVVVV